MVFAILVFWASIAVCSGLYDEYDIMPDRPSTSKNHKRIVPRAFDGQDATIEDFPYILSLRVGTKFTQAAAIISPNWALTIASSLNTADASAITLRGGSALRESGGQMHFVKRMVVHPQFKTGSSDYDFVLLEMESPLVLNDQVQPVALPRQGYEVPANTKANVSGWGNLKPDGNGYSTNLKYAEVNTLSDEKCELLNSDFVTYTPRLLCANIVGEDKNPCAGDQGGPLVADGLLIGLVISDECGIEPTHSNIYAKVAYQREWIDSVTGFYEIPNGPHVRYGYGIRPLIFNGQDAKIEEFPYILSLRVGAKFQQGATIINPKWALTIASTMSNVRDGIITLRAGSVFRENGGNLHFVTRVVIHPQFTPNSNDYNFALLEVDPPFKLNYNVQPVILPKQGFEVPAYTKANVSGWGNLNNGEVDYSMNLKYAQVNTLSAEACELLNQGLINYTARIICAHIIGEGKNPCAGDRGGPLVADGVLIGVIISDICDQELTYSKVYAKVSDQRQWIDSIAGVYDPASGYIGG